MANRVSLDCGKAGKLASAQAIDAIYAEAFRRPMPSGREYTENVSPARSGQNVYWQNPRWQRDDSPIPDYKRAIDTLREERAPGAEHGKIRKDAVLVRSMIYQVSPAHFFPEIANWSQRDIDLSKFHERGPLDMDRVNAWHDTMQDFLLEKYGDCVLSTELHLDENSPHLHVQIVPITRDGRLCSKELFSPNAIRNHLDEVGRACAHLGLERAREGRKPMQERTTPDQWERIRETERERDIKLARERESIDRQISQGRLPEELLPPQIPEKPREPEKPGLLAGREEKERYRESMDDYREKLAEYERQADPRHRAAEQKKSIMRRLEDDRRENEHLRENLRSAQEEAREARAEAAELRKQMRALEAERLRAISITDVMERCYPGKFTQDRDRTIWRSDDGRKIGITGQKFIDNHDRGFSGAGAIDFVKAVDGCNVREACGKLRDYFGETAIIQHLARQEPERLAGAIRELPRMPEPELPTPDKSKTRAIKNWMERELAISPATAERLLSSGQVYADARQNCIVPRPMGGAFVRGTVQLRSGERNTYKHTLGSKRAGAGKLLVGKEERGSILAEGITDALALADRYPDMAVYIIGGNLYPDLPDLREPVYLAFDPDKAGQEHMAHYRELYPEAQELLPPEGRDWSECHILEAARERERAREDHGLEMDF